MLARPYRYVRYTWWREVDLDSVSEELGGSYKVEAIDLPSTKEEISPSSRSTERG
jgi:hypothetical protein